VKTITKYVTSDDREFAKKDDAENAELTDGLRELVLADARMKSYRVDDLLPGLNAVFRVLVDNKEGLRRLIQTVFFFDGGTISEKSIGNAARLFCGVETRAGLDDFADAVPEKRSAAEQIRDDGRLLSLNRMKQAIQSDRSVEELKAIIAGKGDIVACKKEPTPPYAPFSNWDDVIE
jgi:hypothetical protein